MHDATCTESAREVWAVLDHYIISVLRGLAEKKR